MKIFNPTPEQVITKCGGVAYPLDPHFFINVSQATGDWIMEHYGQFGLVDLTPPQDAKKEEIQKLVIFKTLEGLEKYVNHIHGALEQYVALDTELKQQNVYGTVLKHKNVRRLSELLEQAMRMIGEIEVKYGVSIKKTEMEEKTTGLMNSIEAMVTAFESDTEAQEKARVQEAETEQILKDIVPESFGLKRDVGKKEDKKSGMFSEPKTETRSGA